MGWLARALLLAVVIGGTLSGASCVGEGPAHRPGTDPGTSSLPAPGASPAPAETAVLTQKDDPARDGWASHETLLNHANVTPVRFGRRLAYGVDGQVYAQPLYVPGLQVAGGRHNAVIVATERDSVYAFDADAAGPAPAPLWRTSFLAGGAAPLAALGDVKCGALVPNVGITGTPVIDPATLALYVVAATREGPRILYRMHELDLATGRDRVAPVVVQASVPGTGLGSAGGRQTFVASMEQQRMGLLLLDGVVYAAFASYCDRAPSNGWILGYTASDLRQVVAYNDSPDGYLGGLWEAGTGLGADGAGHLFFASGNGTFDLDRGGRDAANTLVEAQPGNGTLSVVDYFAPFNQSCMNHHDQELGSGAPLLLPGQGEVIVTGKEGRIYVTDLRHMGGYRTVPDPCGASAQRTDVDQVIQELPPNTLTGGIWGSQSVWSGEAGMFVYTAAIADHLRAWRLVDGRLVTPSASQAPEGLVYPGGIPVVSSDGGAAATAVVWLLDQSRGPALRAYDATDLSHELYSSQQNPRRDGFAGYVKFSVPTVAAGHVFVGTGSQLLVFGLLG